VTKSARVAGALPAVRRAAARLLPKMIGSRHRDRRSSCVSNFSGVVLVRFSSLLDDRRARVRVPLRLGFSVVAAALALWIVGAVAPILGLPVLFPAFVGIVFVSAELAGSLYGVITTVLFGAGYAFLYVAEPARALGLEGRQVIAVLAAFILTGVMIAGVGGALRKAVVRARAEHRAVAKIHEEREDLLKTLTHDVRSPLNAITLNATMLERDAKDGDTVLRRARAIEKSAGSLASMLGDLIETVQLESGHIPLDRHPVDLGSFVRELESRLEGTLPLDRVHLGIPEGIPALYVDPRRLERILVNLLSNALKYAAPPTPVVLGAAVERGNVVVSVADRGPGISQEDLPHIFDKYYRASGARTKEGLGLGLYATRLLVEMHGGRIWVDSAPGSGTTFYVALPAAPPTEQPAAASTPSGPDCARDDAVVRRPGA